VKQIEMSQGERERHERLLSELEDFRGKLLSNLLSWTAEGNLEESSFKDTIYQLAAVQGCINAAREHLFQKTPAAGNA
jgi:hypothetical protein